MLLAAASAALAQGSLDDKRASEAEGRAVTSIVECLVAGLPEDWREASMQVNLEKPLDATGAVRYFMVRGDSTTPEPFTPCDAAMPAKTLLEVRQHQTAARRGWIGAQVVIFRDGRFGIRYGYPQ